ncbi:hypothetical protein RESH_01616 [Rhodopirellula europaea SH398]|uniref:Uncharacterized protein n=1 Tax=Rhodopirellula europaea SH398 TaxID=1263868 RepID=M5S8C7_9BACT|nr:hypothetical protein RESH_01616 [Rhodopirellula europaea SH398]
MRMSEPQSRRRWDGGAGKRPVNFEINRTLGSIVGGSRLPVLHQSDPSTLL